VAEINRSDLAEYAHLVIAEVLRNWHRGIEQRVYGLEIALFDLSWLAVKRFVISVNRLLPLSSNVVSGKNAKIKRNGRTLKFALRNTS